MNLPKALPKLAAVVALLIIIGISIYFIYNYFQTSNLEGQSDTISSASQVRKLVEQVSKLTDLPIGEEPSIVTITDIQKLNDQPFFNNAKNGDKILIYTHAKKAILFDPIAGKIIEVAPFQIGSASAQLTSQTQAKIVLRNGTSTTGLATRIETQLKKTIQDLNISSKENASKNNYAKTTIVVISDKYRDLANKIADILKASVGALPAGELKPQDADILVIIGKDNG